MADGINLRVRAVGLQKDVENQARAAQKTLSRQPIKLTLDAKAFQQPLGRITGDMSEFQKSLDASTARVFAFGATVGVINGVTEAFKGTVAAVIDVEKALTDINVIMELTGSQLEEFSDSLFDVAQNTSQTFATVAEAATEFARQGLSAEETLQRVNDALILTRLSGLDATASVEALTAVVNGFAQAGLNTTDVINRLANVDAAFAVSTKDLADALSRSGATAQSAGVEFNELLAIVTSVQQQTARGGAVIGNAFKSIFTRIQRSKVRETLEDIGVATTDSAGNFRSAISVLQDYAKVYPALTDAQQAFTAEQIAGVFQINNLKALVSDLNNEFSIYSQALSTAASSTDQAIQRNEALNQTFAALVAQTSESVRELAQSIGELALAPGIEKVLTMLQSVVETVNSMMDEETGNQIMQSFFKGVGNFISGPGLAIVAGAFGALLKNVVSMAANAVRDLFKINTETARQKALQEGILQVLLKDEAVYQRLVSAGGNQNKQAQILLQTVRQITAEYSKQQGLIAGLAKSSALKGVTFQGGQFKGTTAAAQKKIGGVAAEGYTPDKLTFIAGQTPAMDTFAFGGMPEVKASVNAGYAKPVEAHQVREMNVPNLGNVMYNTQESVVKIPNMAQPFIVPPATSKAYPNYANKVKENFGEKMGNIVLGKAFTPSQRTYAEGLSPTVKHHSVLEKHLAQGLVPNFIQMSRIDNPTARAALGDKAFRGQPLSATEISKALGIKRDAFRPNEVYEYKGLIGTGTELSKALTKKDGKLVPRSDSRLGRSVVPQTQNSISQRYSIGNRTGISMLVPTETAGDSAQPITVTLTGDQITQKLGRSGEINDAIGRGRLAKQGIKREKDAKSLVRKNLKNDIFNVTFSKSGVQDLERNESIRQQIDNKLTQGIEKTMTSVARPLIKGVNFSIDQSEVKKRAEALTAKNTSLTGQMFEDVITIAIGKSALFSDQDDFRTWDFSSEGERVALNRIFDKRVRKRSDAKRSDSAFSRKSIAQKALIGTEEGKRALRKAITSAKGLAPEAAYFGGQKELNKNIKKAKTKENVANELQVPNMASLASSKQFFAGIGKNKSRAVALDVDDTLIQTSQAIRDMGLTGRDKFKAFSDPDISKQIARSAPLTPLGKRIQNLKNKDDVFILTAAAPSRNTVLADRFGIPENKIISLQDPKVIKNFGLDKLKPSKRGLSRKEKDPNYQLGTKKDDFRKLNTGEQKRKVLDSLVSSGIKPTLYDDNLKVIESAGAYGRLVNYAAEGLIPNFVDPRSRIAKLKALRDNNGATKAERQNANRAIERILESNTIKSKSWFDRSLLEAYIFRGSKTDLPRLIEKGYKEKRLKELRKTYQRDGYVNIAAKGVIPNFENKQIASRIYESILATNSYGTNVPFEDTMVETIEIDGKKQPVAVNKREQIFKTGKDVQRHFGLDSRPSGGMVLAPSNTVAGRENRKEFASKVENAAGGIVPNFATISTLSSVADMQSFFTRLERGDVTALNQKFDFGTLAEDLQKGKNPGVLHPLTTSTKGGFGKGGLEGGSGTVANALQKMRQINPGSGDLTGKDLLNLQASDRKTFKKIRDAMLTRGALREKGIGALQASGPVRFQEGKKEEREKERKKYVEKGIVAAYPNKGTPRVQRGYIKEPDGDRWQVDFLGTGINDVGLADKETNLKKVIANEFSVALTNVSKQFKISGALGQVGAEAQSLRANLKQNIEASQLPVITGNIFDIVVKTLAQRGSKFKDAVGKAEAGPGTNAVIDIENVTPQLGAILSLGGTNAQAVELKNSPTQEILNDVAYKILRKRNLYQPDFKPTKRQRLPKRPEEMTIKAPARRTGKGSLDSFFDKQSGVQNAEGYIPNLVDFSDKRFKLDELPNLPQGLQKGVNDAIQREKDAGVPASKIRVDFPSADGLVPNLAKMPPVAVTNTRDEGNFASASTAVATGIRKRQTAYRQANISGNPMLAGTDMEFAAAGIIPNLVDPLARTKAAEKARKKAIDDINKTTKETVNKIDQASEGIQVAEFDEGYYGPTQKELQKRINEIKDFAEKEKDKAVKQGKLGPKSILTPIGSVIQKNEETVLKKLQETQAKKVRAKDEKIGKGSVFSQSQYEKMQTAVSIDEFDAVVEERLQQSKEDFERAGKTDTASKTKFRKEQDKILKQAGYDQDSDSDIIKKRTETARAKLERSRQISSATAEQIGKIDATTAKNTQPIQEQLDRSKSIRQNRIEQKRSAMQARRNEREFQEKLTKEGQGLYGESASKVITKNIQDYGKAFNTDRGSSRSRAELQKDITTALNTQKAIDQSNIDEAEKGLSEQKKRISALEEETKQAKKSAKLSSDQIKARTQIIKDLKAQRKAQKTAFAKQFQRGIYNPAVQNLAFAAPFALSVGSGFIPEGEGGTAKGQALGALSGAAQGASLGSIGFAAGPQVGLVTTGAAAIIGGVAGALNKANPSLEEFTKELQNANSAAVAAVNSTTNYVKTQDQLNQAIAAGDQKAVVRLQKSLNQAFSEIADPSIRNRIISAGGDLDKLSEVLSGVGTEARNAAQDLGLISQTKTIAEETGKGVVSSKDIESLGTALSARGIESLTTQQQVQEARQLITGDDANVEEALEAFGIGEVAINKILESGLRVEDVFDAIAKGLDERATTIAQTQILESLNEPVKALTNFNKQINRAAAGLSSEFTKISSYFEKVNSLSENLFKQRLDLGVSAGTLSKQQAREQFLSFQTSAIDVSRGVETEALLANFFKETRSFEDADVKSLYEKAFSESISPDEGKRVDFGALAEKFSEIISQQDLGEDTELIQSQTELVKSLQDLQVASELEKAALDLNNNLLQRQEAIDKRERRIPPISSDDVRSFKQLAIVQSKSAQDLDKNLSSQSQIATITRNIESIFKQRGIEPTGEFQTAIQGAEETRLQVDTIRALTSVPGLNFVTPESPNYAPGSPEQFFLPSLDQGQLDQQIQAAGGDINQINAIFDNLKKNTDEFLKQRFLETPQYQEFAEKELQDPARRGVFESALSSYLGAQRESFLVGRQEQALSGFSAREVQTALAERISQGLGIDLEKVVGDKATDIPEFSRKIAESITKAPLEAVTIKQGQAQITQLEAINANTSNLADVIATLPSVLEGKERADAIVAQERETQQAISNTFQQREQEKIQAGKEFDKSLKESKTFDFKRFKQEGSFQEITGQKPTDFSGVPVQGSAPAPTRRDEIRGDIETILKQGELKPEAGPLLANLLTSYTKPKLTKSLKETGKFPEDKDVFGGIETNVIERVIDALASIDFEGFGPEEGEVKDTQTLLDFLKANITVGGQTREEFINERFDSRNTDLEGRFDGIISSLKRQLDNLGLDVKTEFKPYEIINKFENESDSGQNAATVLNNLLEIARQGANELETTRAKLSEEGLSEEGRRNLEEVESAQLESLKKLLGTLNTVDEKSEKAGGSLESLGDITKQVTTAMQGFLELIRGARKPSEGGEGSNKETKAKGHVPAFAAEGNSYTGARAKSESFADGPAAKAAFDREKFALMKRGFSPMAAESSIQYHTPNFFSETNKSFITNRIDEGLQGNPASAYKAAAKLHGISNARDFYNHNIGTPSFYAQPKLPEDISIDKRYISSSKEIFKHESDHIEKGQGKFDIVEDKATYGVAFTEGKVALTPDALKPVKGDPVATIEKMEQIKRAAVAPTEPSDQDMAVARVADENIQVAYSQLDTINQEKFKAAKQAAEEKNKLSPKEIERRAEKEDSKTEPVLAGKIQKKVNYFNQGYVPNFASRKDMLPRNPELFYEHLAKRRDILQKVKEKELPNFLAKQKQAQTLKSKQESAAWKQRSQEIMQGKYNEAGINTESKELPESKQDRMFKFWGKVLNAARRGRGRKAEGHVPNFAERNLQEDKYKKAKEWFLQPHRPALPERTTQSVPNQEDKYGKAKEWFLQARRQALPERTTQSVPTQEDPIQETIDFINKERLIIEGRHSDLTNKMPLAIRNLIQGGEKKKDPRQLVDEKLTLGQNIKQDAQLSRGDQQPDDTDWSRMLGVDAALWVKNQALPLSEKHPWAIPLLKSMGSVVGAGALGYAAWKAADWMFQEKSPKPVAPKAKLSPSEQAKRMARNLPALPESSANKPRPKTIGPFDPLVSREKGGPEILIGDDLPEGGKFVEPQKPSKTPPTTTVSGKEAAEFVESSIGGSAERASSEASSLTNKARKYYLASGGKTYGPFTGSELGSMQRELGNTIGENTHLWTKGQKTWVPAQPAIDQIREKTTQTFEHGRAWNEIDNFYKPQEKIETNKTSAKTGPDLRSTDEFDEIFQRMHDAIGNYQMRLAEQKKELERMMKKPDLPKGMVGKKNFYSSVGEARLDPYAKKEPIIRGTFVDMESDELPKDKQERSFKFWGKVLNALRRGKRRKGGRGRKAEGHVPNFIDSNWQEMFQLQMLEQNLESIKKDPRNRSSYSMLEDMALAAAPDIMPQMGFDENGVPNILLNEDKILEQDRVRKGFAVTAATVGSSLIGGPSLRAAGATLGAKKINSKFLQTMFGGKTYGEVGEGVMKGELFGALYGGAVEMGDYLRHSTHDKEYPASVLEEQLTQSTARGVIVGTASSLGGGNLLSEGIKKGMKNIPVLKHLRFGGDLLGQGLAYWMHNQGPAGMLADKIGLEDKTAEQRIEESGYLATTGLGAGLVANEKSRKIDFTGSKEEFRALAQRFINQHKKEGIEQGGLKPNYAHTGIARFKADQDGSRYIEVNKKFKELLEQQREENSLNWINQKKAAIQKQVDQEIAGGALLDRTDEIKTRLNNAVSYEMPEVLSRKATEQELFEALRSRLTGNSEVPATTKLDPKRQRPFESSSANFANRSAPQNAADFDLFQPERKSAKIEDESISRKLLAFLRRFRSEGYVPNFAEQYHPTATLNKLNPETGKFEKFQPITLQEKLFEQIGKYEDQKLYKKYIESKKDTTLLNQPLKAYLPTKDDVPTIGFGRTEGVNMQTTSTLQNEINKFTEDLQARETKVKNLVGNKTYNALSDNQKVAVNSLAYNVGLGAFGRSQALKKLKEGDHEGYLKEASEFRLQKGKVLQGLVNRRKDEANLFKTSDPTKLEGTHRKLYKGHIPNFHKLTQGQVVRTAERYKDESFIFKEQRDHIRGTYRESEQSLGYDLLGKHLPDWLPTAFSGYEQGIINLNPKIAGRATFNHEFAHELYRKFFRDSVEDFISEDIVNPASTMFSPIPYGKHNNFFGKKRRQTMAKHLENLITKSSRQNSGGYYYSSFLHDTILPALKKGKSINELPEIDLEAFNAMSDFDKTFLGAAGRKKRLEQGETLPVELLYKKAMSLMINESLASYNEDLGGKDKQLRGRHGFDAYVKPEHQEETKDSLAWFIGLGNKKKGHSSLDSMVTDVIPHLNVDESIRSRLSRYSPQDIVRDSAPTSTGILNLSGLARDSAPTSTGILNLSGLANNSKGHAPNFADPLAHKFPKIKVKTKEETIQDEIKKAIEEQNGNRMLERIAEIQAPQSEKLKALFSNEELAEAYMESLDVKRRTEFFNKYLKKGGAADQYGKLGSGAYLRRRFAILQKDPESALYGSKKFTDTPRMKARQERVSQMAKAYEGLQKQKREAEQANFINVIYRQQGKKGIAEYYANRIAEIDNRLRQVSINANDPGATQTRSFGKAVQIQKEKEQFKKEFERALLVNNLDQQISKEDLEILGTTSTPLKPGEAAEPEARSKEVVKQTLFQTLGTQDQFDSWYESLKPKYRQEMFVEMEKAGMLDRLPPEYVELYKKKLFVGKRIDFNEGVGPLRPESYLAKQLTPEERADPVNLDRLALPERVLEKKRKERAKTLVQTYQQDPSLFYSQWLNANEEQKNAALDVLERTNAKIPVEKFKASQNTAGYIPGEKLSPAAINNLDVSKYTTAMPSLVKYYLEQGRDLYEAIQVAERRQSSLRGRSASGHVPNFVVDPASRMLEKRGAKQAGYSAGAVKSSGNFIYNSAEKFIPKQKLARMTGMSPDGPAIIPPSYTKAGRSTISELADKTGMHESMFASQGHVPNFAGGTGITAYNLQSKESTTKALTAKQIEKAAIERRREQTGSDKAQERAAQYSPRQQTNERVKGDSTDQAILGLQDKAKNVKKVWSEQNPFKTAKTFYSKTPAERTQMLELSQGVDDVAKAAQTKIDVAYIEQMAQLLQNSPDIESANVAITADAQVDLPSAVQVRDVTKRGAEAVGALAKEKQNPIGLNKSNFIEYLEKATSSEASGSISYVDQATMGLSLAIDKRLQKVWSEEGISALNYSPTDSLEAAVQGLQPDDLDKRLAKQFAKGSSMYSSVGHVPNFAGGTGITAYNLQSKESTTKALTAKQIEKAAIERRREQTGSDKAQERAAQYSPRQQTNERVKGDSTDQAILGLQDKAKNVKKVWSEQNPFKTAKTFYSKTPAERTQMLELSEGVDGVAKAAQTKIDVAYIEQMAQLLQNSPDIESANVAITADAQVDLPSAVQVRDVTKRGAEAVGALAKEKQNPIGLNKSNFIEYLEKATSSEASGSISYVDQAMMGLSLAIDKRLQKVWSEEGISALNYSPTDSLEAAVQGLQPDDLDKRLAKQFAKGSSMYSSVGHVPNFAGNVFSGMAAMNEARKTSGGKDAINRELNALQASGIPKSIASQKVKFVSSSDESRSDFVINDYDEGPVTNEQQALNAVKRVHGSRMSNLNTFNAHGMSAFGKVPNFTKMNLISKVAGPMQSYGYGGVTAADADKSNKTGRLGKKLAALGITPNFNKFTKLDKNITKGNFRYQGLQTPASNKGNYDIGFVPNFFAGSSMKNVLQSLQNLQDISKKMQAEGGMLSAFQNSIQEIDQAMADTSMSGIGSMLNQNALSSVQSGMANTQASSESSLFGAASIQSNAFDMSSIFDKLVGLNIDRGINAGQGNIMEQALPAAVGKQTMNLTHDLDQQFKNFFGKLSGEMQKLFDTKMVPESIDLNARLTTQIKGLGNTLPKQFNDSLKNSLEQDNSKFFNGSLGSLSLGNAPSLTTQKFPVSRDGSNPMGTKWFGTDNTQGFA